MTLDQVKHLLHKACMYRLNDPNKWDIIVVRLRSYYLQKLNHEREKYLSLSISDLCHEAEYIQRMDKLPF